MGRGNVKRGLPHVPLAYDEGMWRWSVFCFSAALAMAQGTKPKANPADYDAWINAGKFDLAAEYMVHSFSEGEQMFLAEHYLVVEVAFFAPMKDTEFSIDPRKFGLRLNGKTLIAPQSPDQAAASLKFNQYNQRQSGLSGGIGVGPIGVPIGQSPYPPQQYPQPRQPRAPDQDAPGGYSREKVTPEAVLLRTALPVGTQKGVVSGFVYFPFDGKLKSIKTVELVYGEANLKLK